MSRQHSFAVLRKPARKVIRHQAKRLLKKADKAVARLDDPRDAEALHDARVALRKLRAWLQAFRDELPLKRKQRHALRDLAHSTNAVRDAEVDLELLERIGPRMTPKTARFASRLRTARTDGYRRVREEMPAAWHKLDRKLRRAVKGADAHKSRFRSAFRTSLRGYARSFERARRRAGRDPTPPNIHALRIAGKKARYLVETVLKPQRSIQPFIREMTALHDAAGSIQDLQRLRILARRQAGISRAAAQEQLRHIAGFRRLYLGESSPRCVQELRGLLKSVS